MNIIYGSFEWDDQKDKANQLKHKLSFSEASRIFDNAVLTKEDNREYTEKREISLGEIDGIVVIMVVHTRRDERIRIISARKANTKEREVYYDYIKEAV